MQISGNVNHNLIIKDLILYDVDKLLKWRPLLEINPYTSCSVLNQSVGDSIPVLNMPLCASTGLVLARCCQHQTSTGSVLATNCMFIGFPCLFQCAKANFCFCDILHLHLYTTAHLYIFLCILTY